MLKKSWSCLAVLALLSACGPAGSIAGRVTVEGGSAAGIAVFVYGPSSGATVTDGEGAFTVSGLPDGEYVVRATVRDADVEEVSVSTTIAQGGVAAPEPVLNFKASAATVTGRVVFADGAEASNLSVIATGPETVGTRTATDGTFSFSKIKNGAYVVSVEVRDTREGRVGIGVDASGTKDVGELRLTPVGQLKGIATYNGAPAVGVSVTVPGTSVSSVTDAMGVFSLVNVPTGTQSVLARTGSEPFFRSANAVVIVQRGVNPDVPLDLTDDAPRTGTIQGLVTFLGARSPRDIQVTVQGANVSGTPAANGVFAITAPVGVWEVVATAPSHPKLSLGQVVVREGEITQLPGASLSWYRPIWRGNSTVTIGGISSINLNPFAWSFLTISEGTPRLAIVHAQTGELRFLAVGGFSSPQFSRNAKYAAWYVGDAVFLYEIATGTLTSFGGEDAVSTIGISTDESTLFVARTLMSGRSLTRIPIANPAMAQTFPASGGSTDIRSQNADRWFVRENTDEYHLVTPTSDLAAAFTAVNGSLNTNPTAWAYTNCTVNCQVRVLSPTATTAAVALSGVSVANGSVSSLGSSSTDYPCFSTSTGPRWFCAKSSDGAVFNLPANVNELEYNVSGTRMIYRYTNAGGFDAVREEAVPPSPSTTDLDVSGSLAIDWIIGWLSPTRAVAYESGTTVGRKLRVVTNGTAAAADTEVGTQTFRRSGPLLASTSQTTSKWRAMLGDGAFRPVDEPSTSSASVVARPFQGDTMTRYGAITFDPVFMYVVDDAAGMVRRRADGTCGTALRSGSVELCIGNAPGAVQRIFTFQNNATLEYLDPSLTPSAFVGSMPTTLGVIGISNDGHSVMLGSITP